MFNCYKSNKKLPKVSYEGNQKRSRDLMLFNGIACSYIKGTLMQIWKFANVFVFMWKKYVEGFILKHLLFYICRSRICEKFVYKHSEIIEYVKN